MKFRVKKKCGKCKHLMFYLYVHCKIGAIVRYRSMAFVSIPSDPVDCRDKRQDELLRS